MKPKFTSEVPKQIKENIKAPRHCTQRASNAENVSILWRHHDSEEPYGERGRMLQKIIELEMGKLPISFVSHLNRSWPISNAYYLMKTL